MLALDVLGRPVRQRSLELITVPEHFSVEVAEVIRR